jgi:hypothetical protein
MKTEITLTVEWEVSEISGDDRIIDSQETLLDYIVGTLESNANFDRVDLKVINCSAKELD